VCAAEHAATFQEFIRSIGMKRFLVASLAALLVVGFGLSASADEGWIVDFKAAQELAAKEGKDILMEFTGSDWCPPCIKLKAEVFDKDEFKTIQEAQRRVQNHRRPLDRAGR
jgi:thioredoxin-related protein